MSRLQNIFTILEKLDISVGDKYLKGMKRLEDQKYTLNDLDVFLLGIALKELSPSSANWKEWTQIFKWVHFFNDFYHRNV